MPTYQYACTECGHAFEQFQSFSDDALTVCPECDGRLRKLFNAVGVVFKGAGFYRNDSRSNGRSGGGNDGANDGASGGADGTAAKTESTPKSESTSSDSGSGSTSSTSSSDSKVAAST